MKYAVKFKFSNVKKVSGRKYKCSKDPRQFNTFDKVISMFLY